MEKRFANGKRFNADPAEIENLERNKAKQIIGIVIGAVVLILAFVFGHLQNEAYDHSEHELYNVLKICCIIIGLSNIVLSPIVLYGYMGVERNLSQTHIILYDDGIEGVCINNGVCVPFAVSYFEVVGAVTGSAMVDNGSNLKIKIQTTPKVTFLAQNCTNFAYFCTLE